MLTSSGQQFNDWSAAYRLFEKERIDIDKLFEPVRESINNMLPEDLPFVAVLDDTIIRKRGRKTHGASWRRDPLGPPFHTNFVWSQRYLQTALILPEAGLSSGARAIPVDLKHCPTSKRPGKRATDEDWKKYRADQQVTRITAVGAESIRKLRADLDDQKGGKDRGLVVCVDGGYTNGVVFRNIPDRTSLIGRVRKDAKLFLPPVSEGTGRGRRRIYGDSVPTPEDIRQDATIPWRTVEAYATGKLHQFDVKVVGPVRWKGAGKQDLTLIVIRPLSYRPTRNSRLLYRQPAYLLCTNSQLSVEEVLQSYLWRWEIEVTFKEEKTILGMGEAQVRTEAAVKIVPPFIAAMYAYLHLAAASAGIRSTILPHPKWRRRQRKERCATQGLIGLLRTEMWGRALGVIFNGFNNKPDAHTKPLKMPNSVASAVIYARR